MSSRSALPAPSPCPRFRRVVATRPRYHAAFDDPGASDEKSRLKEAGLVPAESSREVDALLASGAARRCETRCRPSRNKNPERDRLAANG